MRIIGLTGVLLDENGAPKGVKGVGKSTVARLLSEIYEDRYECHILHLADPLKRICSEHFQIPSRYFFDERLKDMLLPRMFQIDEKLPSETITPRSVLEFVGDKFRQVDENVFIHALLFKMQNLQRRQQQLHENFHPHISDILRQKVSLYRSSRVTTHLKPVLVLVPDVRFFNEYAWLKKQEAQIIQVRRMMPDLTHIKWEDLHLSNRPDEAMEADFVVDNRFESLDELKSVLLSWKTTDRWKNSL